MQVNNIFLPVQNLTRTTINPGGMCWVLFFLHQDVATWPEIDPTTGVINQDIVFKSGATFFTLQTSEKGRIFKEVLKYSNAGPYLENEVAGTICGTNPNHITSIAAMPFQKFGILFRERNGEVRLMGHPDAGCRFEQDYTSGDIYSSRLRNVKFSMDTTTPVPIYMGGNIIIDNTVIPIGGSTGGTTTTLQKLISFEVGTSQMNDGDTTFTHPGLAGKGVMVFAGGMYLPGYANPSKRYVTVSGTTITFNGGVSEPETIEIFIY